MALKIYQMPDGLTYQYEEGQQPSEAKLVEEKKPEKATKPKKEDK